MLNATGSIAHRSAASPTRDAVAGTNDSTTQGSSRTRAFSTLLELERAAARVPAHAEGARASSATLSAGLSSAALRLLEDVKSRAEAAGLHPSAASVYRTAIEDLEQRLTPVSPGDSAASSPISTGLKSTYLTPNSNSATGAGYVMGGTTPGVAPTATPDMSGPSSDTQTYLQQLFTLESDPSARGAALASGSWPTEATNDAWRRQAIIQLVAVEVAGGAAFNQATQLTNAQVAAAREWAESSPGLNLNPAYAAALDRAATVASQQPDASRTLPWPAGDTTVVLLPEGSFGVAPVAGYYGTGTGTAPA